MPGGIGSCDAQAHVAARRWKSTCGRCSVFHKRGLYALKTTLTYRRLAGDAPAVVRHDRNPRMLECTDDRRCEERRDAAPPGRLLLFRCIGSGLPAAPGSSAVSLEARRVGKEGV